MTRFELYLVPNAVCLRGEQDGPYMGTPARFVSSSQLQDSKVSMDTFAYDLLTNSCSWPVDDLEVRVYDENGKMQTILTRGIIERRRSATQ